MRGIARKGSAAVRMALPILLLRRRTGAGVAAYFDLITDDGRLFYGDDFHFGYFETGRESFDEAVAAHTDLVAELASVSAEDHVLDVGCGVGAPAVRIAQRHGCRITGLNISREQVRQADELIAAAGLSELVRVVRGDARRLPFPDATFDAVLCLEVAGDICVTEADKDRLVSELLRVLKPGGRVGFSDLALRAVPHRKERRVLRSLLYHAGEELVSDWPAIFARNGFEISESRCILTETMPTWERARERYEARSEELSARYGPRVVERVSARMLELPGILSRLGRYPVLTATRPLLASPLPAAGLIDEALALAAAAEDAAIARARAPVPAIAPAAADAAIAPAAAE